MIRNLLAAALAAAVPATAWGQLLSGVKVEPREARPGESVRITANLDVTGGINCGLRIHFGDGTTQDYKINQSKDVPLVTTRAYSRSGEYRIKAEPKTVGLVAKCGGRNQEATLTVLAPPPPPAPAQAPAAPVSKAPATTSASTCPQGWTLVAKSVNRKTGAFTCTAKAGTPLPEGKLDCPGDLGYFENEKKRQLGCRP